MTEPGRLFEFFRAFLFSLIFLKDKVSFFVCEDTNCQVQFYLYCFQKMFLLPSQVLSWLRIISTSDEKIEIV